MPQEFPAGISVRPKLAEGALAALDRGDSAEHDRLAALAGRDLVDCEMIALAQFSLARRPCGRRGDRPQVLTTPHSAVRKLRALLA